MKNNLGDPRWYRVADYAPTMFWFLMGASLGACLAVFTGAVSMQPDLANLLGGILGAGLGAAGGVVGGLAVYARERRDSLLPVAVGLEGRLRLIEIILQAVADAPANAGHLDVLENVIQDYLKDADPEKAAVIGVEALALATLSVDILRTMHRHMGTTEFDECRSAETQPMAGYVRQMQKVLAQLMPILRNITGST